MNDRSWSPPANVTADSVIDWMCASARELVPSLSADPHTALHAIANALADDLVANAAPPVTLTVGRENAAVSISVADGRDYVVRITRPLTPEIEDIRPLTCGLRLHRIPGQRGCTLTATLPLPVSRRQRARLRPRRGDRP